MIFASPARRLLRICGVLSVCVMISKAPRLTPESAPGIVSALQDRDCIRVHWPLLPTAVQSSYKHICTHFGSTDEHNNSRRTEDVGDGAGR